MVRRTHLLISSILATLLAGCIIGVSPLSQAQLREYLRDRQITPLLVEEVGGVVTVVLWKDARKLGCYAAWSRGGIEAHQKIDYLSEIQQGTIPEPISVIHQGVFDHLIICFTINDRVLLNQARTLELTYPDGNVKTIPLNGQAHLIIAHPSRSGATRTRIRIYGDNGRVLYDRYRFN